jgi:hypothetical protein
MKPYVVDGRGTRVARFEDWDNPMNAVLVMILCLAGSPERCEAIRPAEWPPQVSLLGARCSASTSSVTGCG